MFLGILMVGAGDSAWHHGKSRCLHKEFILEERVATLQEWTPLRSHLTFPHLPIALKGKHWKPLKSVSNLVNGSPTLIVAIGLFFLLMREETIIIHSRD